jgi:hypothetical protein
MLKQTRIESSKIRAAAKGQECTLNIAGVCSYDDTTTVLCHLPDESHGVGRKSDDLSACFGCSSCHDALDRRSGGLPDDEREFYMRRAMVRTWRILVDMGIIAIKGVK